MPAAALISCREASGVTLGRCRAYLAAGLSSDCFRFGLRWVRCGCPARGRARGTFVLNNAGSCCSAREGPLLRYQPSPSPSPSPSPTPSQPLSCNVSNRYRPNMASTQPATAPGHGLSSRGCPGLLVRHSFQLLKVHEELRGGLQVPCARQQRPCKDEEKNRGAGARASVPERRR